MSYELNVRNVTYGVPQGSVFVALLFLIYINDLPIATGYPMTIFAEDSSIIFDNDCIDNLESEINDNIEYIIN